MTLTQVYLMAVVLMMLSGLCLIVILIFLSRLFNWHTVEDCICWAAEKLDKLFYWIMEKLLGKPEVKL